MVSARNSLSTEGTTVERVCLLLRSVEGPLPSLEQTAERLCISGRSLRRRLASQGCSYQQLIDEERRQRALHYLSNSDLPLGEVAFVLGFSDQSNFRRAFRKWTGRIPSAFRC